MRFTVSSPSSDSTSLPPFAPRSLHASQLLWRLSHPSAFHSRSCGDPRFTTPESSCRSVSNHPLSSHVRFLHARFLSRSGVVASGPFPVCTHGYLGFATSFAGSPRQRGRIEFLIVRTDRLAFRCSPPRLTTTQLRSAFNQSSIWLRVFSPPLQVRSRAHERRRPRRLVRRRPRRRHVEKTAAGPAADQPASRRRSTRPMALIPPAPPSASPPPAPLRAGRSPPRRWPRADRADCRGPGGRPARRARRG